MIYGFHACLPKGTSACVTQTYFCPTKVTFVKESNFIEREF